MSTRKTIGRSWLRRASVIVQTAAFGGLVGVGVAALAVDTGLMFAAKQELQNAADAAALAAASRLGAEVNPLQEAIDEAALFTNLNEVAGLNLDLVETDVAFGHAVFNGTSYDFVAGDHPFDAVRVTLRRDATVSDGPISLAFARVFGATSTDLSASATAMLVPRDISVVVDLSASMNDDSELRHYRDYPSETGGTRPGVQINLEDVWLAIPCEKGNNGVGNGIDPQPPGNPSNYNDQPGTGPGSPNSQGGNPSPGANPQPGGGCTGPRWGWMTGFGNTITLGSYTPVNDSGLYYIPRNAACTDPDVSANLTQASYSAAERSALLSGQFDGTATYYRNRVKVCLGLAGWRSKKSGGKYTGGPGNGDDKVDTNELYQVTSYNLDGGSWDDWINYVSSNSTQMYATDSNFRYRYGIKTFMNYLLEKQAANSACPELVASAEMPLRSVKNAVQTLVDTIVDLQTDDRCSLEVFATTGRHEVSLTDPAPGQTLAEVLQVVADTLNQRQAGHYNSATNIGGGLDKAITELTSDRARGTAAKVIILLSDGKPNVDENNNYVGDGAEAAIDWAIDRAETAADLGMTIYTVGVGGDANDGFLEDLAEIGRGQYFFADNTPDADGQPAYIAELQQIFRTLAGTRPVRLIQ